MNKEQQEATKTIETKAKKTNQKTLHTKISLDFNLTFRLHKILLIKKKKEQQRNIRQLGNVRQNQVKARY